MAEDFAGLRDHIGRTVTATDVVTAAGVAQLAATLGIAPPASKPGEALPVCWHTPFFVPTYGPDRMRHDGQAAGGAFMPDVKLPRNRLRGDAYEFHRPVHIGEALTRTAEIVDVRIEETAVGPVISVPVRARIEGEDGLAVVEERTLFYHGETAPPPEPLPDLPAEAVWRKTIDPTPVLLFRYSAVRFNSHRVHFDRRFCVEEEGLPGLIVHGTLISQLMTELCRTSLPDRRIETFSYLIHKPIYDTGPFEVAAAPTADGNAVTLWATDPDGAVATTGRAGLAA
jgi:3-methylfumaryl-CoA hydratase